MSTDPLDRADLSADLENARIEFHRLLGVARPDDWGRPTHGTRWTNEQLLFHMVFGYMVVQRLLILVKVFNRLPDAAGRNFALALNAATKPFDVINYYGSSAAALAYNRRRMGRRWTSLSPRCNANLLRKATTPRNGGCTSRRDGTRSLRTT